MCHFFNDNDVFNKGVLSYKNTYFKDSKEDQVKIDATPAYLRAGGEVIPRMKFIYGDDEFGDLKFIIMLRDPLERSYSHCLHMVRLGHEYLPFGQALLHEDERLKANYRNSSWWGAKRLYL